MIRWTALANEAGTGPGSAVDVGGGSYRIASPFADYGGGVAGPLRSGFSLTLSSLSISDGEAVRFGMEGLTATYFKVGVLAIAVGDADPEYVDVGLSPLLSVSRSEDSVSIMSSGQVVGLFTITGPVSLFVSVASGDSAVVSATQTNWRARSAATVEWSRPMLGLDLGLGLDTGLPSDLTTPLLELSPTARPAGMTYRRNWSGSASFQPKTLAYAKDNSAPSGFDSTTATIEQTGSTICIAAHGDSVTQGMIVEGWLEKLVRSLAADDVLADYKNRGISGQSFNYNYPAGNTDPTLLLDAASEIDALLANGKANKLIVWAGSNGMVIQGNSAATEIGHATTYIDARIAAGWLPANICLVTMLPRQAFNEATRTSFNNSLVALAATKGCLLAPVHLNEQIGAAGQQNDATMFYDTIHLTDPGEVIAMGIIKGVAFP